MNPRRTIDTTMWIMVLIQTIGSVDLPGQGPRKLPAPRQYVAIVTLWSILGIVADAGSAGAGRAAAMFSWLLVLAGTILGPFGGKLTSFLQAVARLYPTNTSPPPGSGVVSA